MPGSCRTTHGLDVGVHIQRPVPTALIGQTGGCPSGAVFESCAYCGQVHRDSRQQKLYPLQPQQHLQEAASAQASMFEVAAGLPSGVVRALEELKEQSSAAP